MPGAGHPRCRAPRKRSRFRAGGQDRRRQARRSGHRREHRRGEDPWTSAEPVPKYGIKFAATYIGETLENVSGGLKQRAIYEGRLNLAVDVDLQKLAGIDKLTFHANMFQIHGEGLSRNYLDNLFVISGIEALPSTRLYEAYFEKQWGDKKVSLKFGQLAADSEFFNTKYTDVFTNASMG
jgi:porin